MTPHAWDLHKSTYCVSCRFGKRCSAMILMDRNSSDRQCRAFFTVGRDGHCSQYMLDTTRKGK